MSHDYKPPVAKLLHLGEPVDYSHTDRNYLEMGFTETHIPELIRMMKDEDLMDAPGESDEVWAGLHAWRTLAQLRAVAAIPDLIDMFELSSEDDWVMAEIPDILGFLGPEALEPLNQALDEDRFDSHGKNSMVGAFEQIYSHYPETREQSVQILREKLRHSEKYDGDLNGFIVNALIDLEATDDETLAVIKAAFDRDHVDTMIIGDWEDFLIDVGLSRKRSTPRKSDKWTEEFNRMRAQWMERREEMEFDRQKKVVSAGKVGRNDPCPCGSGKKYKKCCLKKEKEKKQGAV